MRSCFAGQKKHHGSSAFSSESQGGKAKHLLPCACFLERGHSWCAHQSQLLSPRMLLPNLHDPSFYQSVPLHFEFKALSTKLFPKIENMQLRNGCEQLSPSGMIDWLIYLSLKYAHMTHHFFLKNTGKQLCNYEHHGNLLHCRFGPKYRWSTPTNSECLDRTCYLGNDVLEMRCLHSLTFLSQILPFTLP
jgi:hypothetical protein